ncbi:MAG: hypothetical protein WAM60_13690, partial [Candidatus Promineifilaceae bacterium]
LEVTIMDNVDRQIGRLLTWREVIKLMGAAGLVMLVGCGPEDEEAASATAANGTTAAVATAEPTTAVAAATTFNIGLDLSDTAVGASDSAGGGTGGDPGVPPAGNVG